MNKFLQAIFFSLIVLKLNAQVILPDSLFGANLFASVDFDKSNDIANAVAIQADGKVLLVGYSPDNFEMARFKTNSTLDSTFNSDGKIYETEGGSVPSALIIQPDGRIVIGGSTSRGFLISRYNIDGSLDTSFNQTGNVTTNFSNAICSAIALQPDGKILAGGTQINGTNDNFLLVRYNQNGSLDTSFGSQGILQTDFNQQKDILYTINIDADNKIIAVGNAELGNSTEIALARYLPNGNLDSTFGEQGKVQTGLPGETNIPYSSVILPNNKILAETDHADVTGNHSLCLVRYNKDGVLDSSFNGSGIIIYNWGKNEFFNGMCIQPDGKIVTTGYVQSPRNKDFIVARFDSTGEPDASFGNAGILIDDLAGEDELAFASALQPDGKIIIAGTNGAQDFAFIRVTTEGLLDTLKHDGKVSIQFTTEGASVDKILVQPDNKIILVGWSCTSNVVARCFPNGQLDATFGTGGKIGSEPFGGADNIDSHPGDALLQKDDKIILVGEAGPEAIIARLQTSGNLDSTFGINGVSAFDEYPLSDYHFSCVALQRDGKIIAAGRTSNLSSATLILVMRYNIDGTVDESFGIKGEKIINVIAGGNAQNATAIVIQPDDKIVICSSAFNGFLVIRMLPNGIVDSSFGTNGIASKIFDGLSFCDPESLAYLPDGKIICAGSLHYIDGVSSSLCLIKYNPDGSFDESFGFEGIALEPLSGYNVKIMDQPDGKILASYIPNDLEGLCMVRFNSNGQIDLTFGKGGVNRTNLGPSYLISSMTSQNDGSLLVDGVVLGSPFCDYSSFFITHYPYYITTGTEDLQQNTVDLFAFPNPGNNWQTLKFYLKNADYVSIMMFDLTGRLQKIIQPYEFLQSGSRQISFKISDFPPGNYLLKLLTRDGEGTIQIAKEIN